MSSNSGVLRSLVITVVVWSLVVVANVVFAPSAHAFGYPSNPRGVGLGVAAGIDYSDYQKSAGARSEWSPAFAWSFFVDIPLLETFYITPQTALYTLDLDGQTRSVTDVDLNFKFIVPLSAFRLGAGLTAGLTSGLGDYRGHYGALGYFGFALVANLEGFVMVQYKRLSFDDQDVDKIHGYAGAMFRF